MANIEFQGLGGRTNSQDASPTPKAKALPKALFVGTLGERQTTSWDEERLVHTPED